MKLLLVNLILTVNLFAVGEVPNKDEALKLGMTFYESFNESDFESLLELFNYGHYGEESANARARLRDNFVAIRETTGKLIGVRDLPALPGDLRVIGVFTRFGKDPVKFGATMLMEARTEEMKTMYFLLPYHNDGKLEYADLILAFPKRETEFYEEVLRVLKSRAESGSGKH